MFDELRAGDEIRGVEAGDIQLRTQDRFSHKGIIEENGRIPTKPPRSSNTDHTDLEIKTSEVYLSAF